MIRYWGTNLRWESDGPGVWRTTLDGQELEIQRRGWEPGYPPGWYYFGPGPGATNGRWTAHYVDEAAEAAVAIFHGLPLPGGIESYEPLSKSGES